MAPPSRSLMKGVGAVVVLLALGLLGAVSGEGHGRRAAGTEKLVRTLKTLEARLHEIKQRTGTVKDGYLIQGAPMYAEGEVSTRIPPSKDRLPGHEWTPSDQAKYDKEMQRALGATEVKSEFKEAPSPLLPISDPQVQQEYAHNLVRIMQGLDSGYLEELLQWAESGAEEENPFIAPIVESIEAPLIKELDAEAHARVQKTVEDIALRKNLSPVQMKKMRARLLVPLLLRIRARVHQQVEVYCVAMIRRVVLDAAKESGKSTDVDFNSYVPPSAGKKAHASDDHMMEYTVRDIDELYASGVLSKRDYNAEKAKVLSDWLGLAIKQIGGRASARKALETFLWPPVMSQNGCRCMLPFKYDVPQLGGKTITYTKCTDINMPGEAWCAIDPDDKHCGTKSTHDRAFIGEGGLGWDHWDLCLEQPQHEPGTLPKHMPKVVTEQGCHCQLPFSYYPASLGGRQKVTINTCTKYGGQEADWCPTKGHCGHFGDPATGKRNRKVSWTHWDKCVGQPAGFLEPPRKVIETVQGCHCRPTWKYKPHDLAGAEITYTGCTDMDSPGTAWCAVDEHSCGTASEDPNAGTEDGKYGWTRWDICEPSAQPTRVMAMIEDHVLPDPAPYVRTEDGCSCKLPFRYAGPETHNKWETFYSCQRFGSFAAWCPVNEKHCGHRSLLPKAYKGKGGFGWTNWDRCIGEPAGFLAPPKAKVLTRDGCVCKLPFQFDPRSVPGLEVVYTGCTDIESPNQPWCAIDPVESPPHCGTKSQDPKANFGAHSYGWDHWDYCMETVESHAQGVMPSPAEPVITMNGCTCKMPYMLNVPSIGTEQKMTTCNRYNLKGGTHSYYWCPVNEETCGHVASMPDGSKIRWDECKGEPAGYLEPTPVQTQNGCECLLPFEYSPEVLSHEKIKTFTYTSCTDIASKKGGAWCATKGYCGTQATHPGKGWTHWDLCTDQPAERALLPSGQPQLPVPSPEVRTQHGCKCKLPFLYAPSSECAIEQLEAGPCSAQGGEMMQGWCVTCHSQTFTECTREDQEASWCAVEGDCGVKSNDHKAKLPESEGGYGWTHWDHCIGEPAGFLPPRTVLVKQKHPTSLHGVTVESIMKARNHGEATKDSVSKAGGAGTKGREEKKIHGLESQVQSSIKDLDNKIQQLSQESGVEALRAPLAASSILLSFLLAGAYILL